MSSVECWSDLLHVVKRILAYPQSVQFILHAQRRWPELFRSVTVSFIPSSMANKFKVRNKSLTAGNIVGRMTSDAEEIALFRKHVLTLQQFALDERIQLEYEKKSFVPIVHAEVLLLDWLHNHGGTVPSRFFNDWAYIGSSKPTCKLCCFFFDGHRPSVGHRTSHGNLYPSWRLPDLLPSHGHSGRVRRDKMIKEVLGQVRDEAFNMVRTKLPPSYKDHDSNTFSATLTLDRNWTMNEPAGELDELASLMGEVELSDQDGDSGDESDADGGVPI